MELLLVLWVATVFSAASKSMWPVADRLAALPAMTLAPVIVTLPLPIAASPLAVMVKAKLDRKDRWPATSLIRAPCFNSYSAASCITA